MAEMKKGRELVTLTQEQYLRLEKALPPPLLDNNTTDLQAGFRLGVQAVLKMIREGFVVS